MRRSSARRDARPPKWSSISLRCGGKGRTRFTLRATGTCASRRLRRDAAFDRGPCRVLDGKTRPRTPPARLRSTSRAQLPADSRGASIPAHQADKAALDINLIGAEDAGLEFRIGGFEGDGGALLTQPLQGRFLMLHEGDDDVTVLGGVAAADDDDVAVVNASFDHRVTLYLQGEVLAIGEQVGRAGDVVAVVLNGADRRAGGDAAHDGHGHRAAVDDGRGGRGEIAIGAAAFDDAGLEATSAFGRCRGWGLIFGEADDLDGSGAVGEAADETALDQRGDEAVDARFRFEVEGILHFVEGWRHALLLHARMDEEQKLFLFFSEHCASRRPLILALRVAATVVATVVWTKRERTLTVL
ncbi:protein of unknown function [Hyphomicrobium sp. 1Nfss2.1]